MSEWGRYVTVGPREYRGHPTGEEFIANLDRAAVRRAILRGDIRHLEDVTPVLPARWGMPDGWSSKVGKE